MWDGKMSQKCDNTKLLTTTIKLFRYFVITSKLNVVSQLKTLLCVHTKSDGS